MTAPALDRRLHAVRPDLADARLRGRVEAARFVEGTPATVAVGVADLRRRPEPMAPLETQALGGEALLVFEETPEGWSWVQLVRDFYVGWMPTIALLPGEAKPATHRVRAPRTLVFPGPDIKQPPMADLPLGALVRSRGEAEDGNARYVLVEPFGAVVRQHLAPLGEPEADFVEVAGRFGGVPYLWGGKSALGIDCSGLVQLALQATGREAPRDTDLQFAGLGRPLGPGETPRRGDLAFWPGHVGILTNAETLLHANAHHMMTAAEPLAEALRRTAAKDVAFLGLKRLQ